MKPRVPAGRPISRLLDPMQIILKGNLTIQGEEFRKDAIVTLGKSDAVRLCRANLACPAPGKLDPDRSANLYINVSENTGVVISENVEQNSASYKKRTRGDR